MLAITVEGRRGIRGVAMVLAGTLVRRRRDQALHFVALGFTLLAIAIALQFDGPAVTIGWAAEGAVVVALGLRERRDWMRAARRGALHGRVSGRDRAGWSDDRADHETVLLQSHAAAAAPLRIALSYGLAWLYHRIAEAAAGSRRGDRRRA